jgi:class 3 adenylate cyclase
LLQFVGGRKAVREKRMSRTSVDSELHERRLSAILAADVAGYSRLMGADEDGTLQALKAHRKAIVDPGIAGHRGRIVKTTGDGLLVEFASAVDAVRCAVDVQRGMAERNEAVPPDQRIQFRIGINVGDIIGDGSDIYGDGVNVAARLETMAEPGGIWVSQAVRDPVVDKLSFGFEDLGEVAAKNIARPIRVFRVRHDIDATQRKLASPRLRRRAVIGAVALLAVISAGSSIWFWGIRPSGDVPKNLATAAAPDASSLFIGDWQGVWDNNPQATTSLTIESVSPTGDVIGSYVFMSGDPTRFVARMTDSTVSFGYPKFTFKIRPDGKMELTRDAAGQLDTAVLTKLTPFSPGHWQGIWDNNPQATTSLTIESVSPTGDVIGSYVFMSGDPTRFVARIVDNTISFGSSSRFTFKIRPDGKMEGTRNLAGQLDTAVLTNLAAFSPGRWEGVWDNNPHATISLTIESVSPTRDTLGSYVSASRDPVRFMARIVDNTISFGSTIRFTFKIRPDGKMEGTRNAAGELNTAVLTRNQVESLTPPSSGRQ